jgi:putative ABC transport system permease protein
MKSIVIGVILFLGAFFMTVGNGIISGMNQGLQTNIIDSFLGHIVIVSEKQESDNILLDMLGRANESFSNYKQIKPVLLAQPYIDKFIPVGKNMAMILDEEMGSFLYLIGVDFAEYQKMFPGSISALEGNLFSPGEKGLLLTTHSRNENFILSGTWLLPEGGKIIQKNLPKDTQNSTGTVIVTADNMVLMGFNEDDDATDVRLGIKGVIRYRAINEIFGHFNFTDIESYRECLGYFSAYDKTVAVAPEEKKLLSMDNTNIDSMFESDDMFVQDTGTADLNEKTLFKRTAKTKQPDVDLETGAYNLLFIKLKPGADITKSTRDLNKTLKQNNLGVRAIPWDKAAGMLGSMSTMIKTTLFMFVMFLFFVAIIIIINTLSMAAIERVTEIGMMRAIGAKKSFITKMFVSETAILAVVFGGGGIIAGFTVIKIIPLLNLTTENDLLQLLYGGVKFQPLLTPVDMLITVSQLTIVVILAVLYPVKVAKDITPLDAVVRD